jgi:hypothetical protein
MLQVNGRVEQQRILFALRHLCMLRYQVMALLGSASSLWEEKKCHEYTTNRVYPRTVCRPV